MDIRRIKEALTEVELAKRISEITEPNELQTTLAGMGIEISVEEAAQTVDLLAKVRSGEVTEAQLERVQQQLENEDELDEEALANISGGFIQFVPYILAYALIAVIGGGGAYALTKVEK